MPDEDVNVSIEDAHLADFDAVVKQLEAAGMRVQETHQNVGIVSGSIDAGAVERLEQLPEVSAVERTRRVPGPPHDRDEPQ